MPWQQDPCKQRDSKSPDDKTRDGNENAVNDMLWLPSFHFQITKNPGFSIDVFAATTKG